MDTFESLLFNSVASDKNIMAKAIANFLFREIIEDAHAKYNISQDDMQEMCREAVNRAAVLEQVMGKEELKKALILYGYSGNSWDAPNAAYVDMKLKHFAEMAKNIGEQK